MHENAETSSVLSEIAILHEDNISATTKGIFNNTDDIIQGFQEIFWLFQELSLYQQVYLKMSLRKMSLKMLVKSAVKRILVKNDVTKMFKTELDPRRK